MNKKFRITFFVLLSLSFMSAYGQKVAVKTNLLYGASTTLNAAAEFKVGKKMSFDIPLSYNPWSFKDNRKFQHFMAQPELRYWIYEVFTGHFFGLHAHYASYDIAGVTPLHIISEHRHKGWLAGAGLSYGYHWVLADRWSVEGTLGVGYAYVDFTRYGAVYLAPAIKKKTVNYFGPTKAGLSLVFMIK